MLQTGCWYKPAMCEHDNKTLAATRTTLLQTSHVFGEGNCQHDCHEMLTHGHNVKKSVGTYAHNDTAQLCKHAPAQQAYTVMQVSAMSDTCAAAYQICDRCQSICLNVHHKESERKLKRCSATVQGKAKVAKCSLLN